jgi:hypothetical protein
MAKIPEFNQPAIPSAIVGTPGVDTSPFQLGAQNLQAEGEQAQFGLEATRRQRALVDQNTEIHRQEQAQAFRGIGDELTAWHNYYAGLQKESDAIYDHTKADSIANNFELDARKLHSDIQAKALKEGSSVNAEEEYKKGFDELTKTYNAKYPELKSNARIAASVGAKINATGRTYAGQMHDFVNKQKPVEAQAASLETYEKMKSSAAAGDYEGAVSLLNSDDTKKSINLGYGHDKAPAEHERRLQGIATAYIDGRLANLRAGQISLDAFDASYAKVEAQIPAAARPGLVASRNTAAAAIENKNEEQETQALVANQLEAAKVKATMLQPRWFKDGKENPQYIQSADKVSAIADAKIKEIEALPPTKQNLALLKTWESLKAETNTAAENYHKDQREIAADKQKAANEVTKEANAELRSEKALKAADKAAKIEEAKLAHQQKLETYGSDGAIAIRNDIRQRLEELEHPKGAFGIANPLPDDAERIRQARELSKILAQHAHDGTLGMSPSDKFAENAISKVQEFTRRVTNKEATSSWGERILNRTLDRAPDIVHKVLNEHGDHKQEDAINTRFHNAMQGYVDAYKSHNKRNPSPEEVDGFRRIVTRKALGLPLGGE